MEAEGVHHRKVDVNGIKMHVVEKGEGPVVLLLHGFPELWYSWRHQILSLAARGYRAVAPDLRGYGDTDAPADVTAYTIFHIVGDLVALIDTLGQDKVFVVGHDWGAIVAWYLCVFRPDRVKALLNLSVAFMPREQALWRVDTLRGYYGDEFYVCRFQEPGEIERQFAQLDTTLLFKVFLTSRNPRPLIIPKEKGCTKLLGIDLPLPSWLSEDDINYFATKFNKSGFTGAVNYYRNINPNWELTSPWAGDQIKVPVKFIVGDLDLAYHFEGMQDYIHNGGFKRDVPLLDDVIVMEGVAHFINQEKPEEISDHIYDFIRKF
ncbi:putative strigolactone esterase D14 like [Apostasia shenzhenica]|uniref:soluble epoxide hydrolase n=1 Tax=Apostasia shenzhenica TaxID=1088818 RepID=A0A2I0AQ83_9ASPA|nr:putative strigolactone esterase D14 like [Apostasia shenzhenica]